MATVDLSRSAFDPRKRYDSLRMQLGSVLVDDDFNENERIDHEDRRRSRVEIIGPAGSPDDGFRIDNAAVDANGNIDFDILPGSFYLGGHRLEQEAAGTFRAQHDLLQMPADAHPAPAATRTDLAVLVAFQQPVRAVEDAELFEVALGGPESAARVRTFQRVMLVEDVDAMTCDEAWENAVHAVAANGMGTLNDEHELVPDTTLTVSFDPGGNPEDLCTPLVAGGYLGAENQAIRVQLTDSGHFVWGFDNGSQVHRVTVAADRQTLTLLTEPRDQAHWPLAGQIGEVLPWGAVLPNNEKVGEASGHLSRLQSSYNPDTGQLTLATPIPTAGFDDWQGRPDASTLDDTGVYYYFRVWHRGADRASDPAIAFTPGVPVALGQTGLRITIEGNDRRPEDFWIIAARPETPNRVVPWELETGKRPHGVRRFIAPLGLIRWDFANGELSNVETTDCRPGFPPLTRRQGCCSVTVGDGTTSRGDVDSVEDAIARLPAAGGTICLLPGTHRTNAEVLNRHNVRIGGCAGRTRVLPRPDQGAVPIFRIVDSSSVTIEQLDLISFEGPAIVAEGTAPGELDDIVIERNRMLTGQTAVDALRGERVTIERNLIRLFDREGAGPAIRLLAEDGRVERNDIGVIPAGTTPPDDEPPDDGGPVDPSDPCADVTGYVARRARLTSFATFYLAYNVAAPATVEVPEFVALGGIEIEAGSERVTILDNIILGGAGNGVTLGSPFTDEDITGLVRRGRAERDDGEVILHHPGERLIGEVEDGNGAVRDLVLSLTDEETASSRTVITDDNGRFVVPDAAQGDYRLSTSTPGYRVVRASFNEDRWTHTIIVERDEGEPPPAEDKLAFLYDIVIERNRISLMGLCGIGVPRQLLDAGDGEDPDVSIRRLKAVAGGVGTYLSLLGSYVIGLRIDANDIERCLQRPFDAAMRGTARLAGLGGISLGICENLLVRWNRIEANGRSHVDPVCGVFVFFAEDADISHNRVIGNGALADPDAELTPGTRGGIVLARTASFSPMEALQGAFRLMGSGRPAARVHDNVVDQPCGRALEIPMAVGPLSIVNNQLNTGLAAVRRRQFLAAVGGNASSLDRAGAVLVADLGTPLMGGLLHDFSRFENIAAGSAFIRDRRDARTARESFAVAGRLRLPGGAVLFNDNQVRLGAGTAVCATLIVSLDDVSFGGNQSLVDAPGSVAVNTYVIGTTVRADDSRFMEAPEQAQGSLLTLSRALNTTTTNQGNHCIFALNADAGRPPVDGGNQSLLYSNDNCLGFGNQLKARQPDLARVFLGEDRR